MTRKDKWKPLALLTPHYHVRNLSVDRERRGNHVIADGREKMAHQRERRRRAEDCAECEHYESTGATMHPPHDASMRCESGRRPHCTCDTCW